MISFSLQMFISSSSFFLLKNAHALVVLFILPSLLFILFCGCTKGSLLLLLLSTTLLYYCNRAGKKMSSFVWERHIINCFVKREGLKRAVYKGAHREGNTC